MKAEIIPPYLTILETSTLLPEGASQTHLFLKAVGHFPTPGWSFRTDSIEISENAFRIIINLTEVAPEQAMEKTPSSHALSINLGRPSAGLHLVEIHARSADDAAHVLRQAFVIKVAKRDESSAQQSQSDLANLK